MKEGALDLPAVLERVGGDKDLLREIAGIFLEEYPSLIGAIRSAVADNDAPRLERAAHALKGSISNFGARPATAAAFELESVGRHNRMSDAPGRLAALEAEFTVVIPLLEQIVQGKL